MELFDYLYNGQKVTRKEFERLKKLEKTVLKIFFRAHNYCDWPLLKYDLIDD